MKVDVFNMKGEKVKTVELPAEIFEAPVNVDLMHQAYSSRWRMPAWVRIRPRPAAKFPAAARNPGSKRGPVAPARVPRGSALGAWWQDPYPAPAQVHAAHAAQDAPCCIAFGAIGQSC